MMSKLRIYFGYSAWIVLLVSVISLQADYLNKRYKAYQPVEGCPYCEFQDKPDVIYIPLKSSTVRLFAPADSDLIADLICMRTNYYFGQHVLTDREYPYLLHLLDLITDLAPKWFLPYYFGAVILPVETGNLDDGFYIIDKALVHHSDNWQLWFFKGYYLMELREDYIEAAKMFRKASMLPNAPIYLMRLSATLATKGGQKELALHFLEEALKHISDPEQRKVIIEKMNEVMSDSDSNSVE